MSLMCKFVSLVRNASPCFKLASIILSCIRIILIRANVYSDYFHGITEELTTLVS